MTNEDREIIRAIARREAERMNLFILAQLSLVALVLYFAR